MNRLFVVVSSLLLVVVLGVIPLLAIGCGDEEATPAPTAAPTATAEPPIELVYSTFTSPTSSSTTFVTEWLAPEVERRTNGRVKITVYSGATLGTASAHYEMVRTGVVDMAYFVPAYTPGVFPVTDIGSLPFLWSSNVDFAPVYYDLYQNGWFDEEYSDIQPIGFTLGNPYQLCLADKKPMALADFSGLKVRTSGARSSSAMEAINAISVSLSTPDLYLALQTGTVDASLANAYFLIDIKWHEVSKYLLQLNLGSNVVLIAMNKDVWNSLPADIQAVFEDLMLEAIVENAQLLEDDEMAAYDTLDEMGYEVYSLPPAEMEKVVSAIMPVVDEFVKDLDEKGLKGTELMADLEAIMTKHGLEYPY